MYVLGDAFLAADLASQIGRRTRAKVISVDYRLAPEHPYPAAVDDALAAYEALLQDGTAPKDIAFAGESAGGGLAVATLVNARDHGLPMPAAAYLMSPYADLTLAGTTMETKGEVDVLMSRENLQSRVSDYTSGRDAALDLISPIFADLSGLPPLVIQAGTHEVLLDDAVRLARQAAIADVDVTLDITPGVPHVFQSFYPILDEAVAALDRAGQLLSAEPLKCGTHHRVAESPTPVPGGMHRMSSITSSASDQRRASPDDRRWLILVIVAIAQLMVVLDATIVNIALPSAQRALGFANSDRQWVVTAYALAFGSLLLVGGRLGDMFSRKWIFIVGLVGFAVASAIGGAAGSFVILVTARALQGAFGALLAPSALGTLVSTFQDPRERGKAFAVFGSVAAGGGGIGLILGGVLTQYLSWRYCLYVNLVFAAIAVAGALVYIRSSRPAVRPRLDWPGTVLACAGLFLIVFGFSRAETAGWTDPLTLGCLVLGPVLLAGFVLAEQRSSHPLLPLRVLVDRTRGGSYVALFISGIAIFGTFLFLTFYLQLIKGESPLTTGLLFLPMIGCILISSNLSSIVLLPRMGPRALITSGMLLGTGGMVYLTQVSVNSSYVGGVLPALLLLGLGFGLIFAPGINTATAGVRPRGLRGCLRAGQHSATGRRLDRDLRPQHYRADRNRQLSGSPPCGPLAPAIAATHGYTLAFAISAGLLGLGFILAIALLPSRSGLEERTSEAAAFIPGAGTSGIPVRPSVAAPGTPRAAPNGKGHAGGPALLLTSNRRRSPAGGQADQVGTRPVLALAARSSESKERDHAKGGQVRRVRRDRRVAGRRGGAPGARGTGRSSSG